METLIGGVILGLFIGFVIVVVTTPSRSERRKEILEGVRELMTNAVTCSTCGCLVDRDLAQSVEVVKSTNAGHEYARFFEFHCKGDQKAYAKEIQRIGDKTKYVLKREYIEQEVTKDGKPIKA